MKKLLSAIGILILLFSFAQVQGESTGIGTNYTTYHQTAKPSSPPSGYNRIYFKTDGKLYYVNSSATEVEVGSGSTTVVDALTSTSATSALSANQGYILSRPSALQSASCAANALTFTPTAGLAIINATITQATAADCAVTMEDTGAVEGSIVIIKNGSDATTKTLTFTTTAGKINLIQGSPFAMGLNESLTLQFKDGVWYEIGRVSASISVSAIDLASATLVVPNGTTALNTTAGRLYFNTSTNLLSIGNGATSTVFSPQSNEKLAVFTWDGGGSALAAAAGTKRCAFVPSASTLTGLYASSQAEPTSDVTIALFKDAFSAAGHATTAMISGTNAVIIPAAGSVMNVNDTTLTNFTKTIAAGDQICATITATDTTTWLQLTLYGKR
jgi:hypothetical protein